jgi:hypothetical protein
MVRKGDDLTTFIVPKVMKNPEALTFRIPKSLFRPIAGKLYLYLYLYSYSRTSNNGHCRGIQILSVIGGVR